MEVAGRTDRDGARRSPKTVTVANSGTGSHTHISAVALFRTAGAEVIDIPFGAAQVVPSLLGGQVDAAVQLPAALAGNVAADNCACSPRSRARAIRPLPKCRRRASRAWMFRLKPGAASRCRKARPSPSSPRWRRRSARLSRAANSPKGARASARVLLSWMRKASASSSPSEDAELANLMDADRLEETVKAGGVYP